MENWIKQLLPIITEYKDGNTDEPLDGDDVDKLCEIIKAKINLHEGNITEEEYNNILDGKQSNYRFKLTNEEKENFFHSALCNGGLIELEYSGIILNYNEKQYETSKQRLKNIGQSPCYEDILMDILKQGGELSFDDVECDGEYSRKVSLKTIYDNIEKAPEYVLRNYIDVNDDATSGYLLLQAIMFDGEIIFG